MLCLCNKSSYYECTSPLIRNKTVAPDQAFNIAMVVQDLYNSNLQGIGISNYYYGGIIQTPLTRESDEITSLSCKNFTYRLILDSESVIETTIPYSFFAGECSNEISLSVMVIPCPAAFDFSSKDGTCNCTDMIQKFAQTSALIINQSLDQETIFGFTLLMTTSLLTNEVVLWTIAMTAVIKR